MRSAVECVRDMWSCTPLLRIYLASFYMLFSTCMHVIRILLHSIKGARGCVTPYRRLSAVRYAFPWAPICVIGSCQRSLILAVIPAMCVV